jgi:hypothetical protein
MLDKPIKKCDNCGKEYNYTLHPYCPNCGPLVGMMQVGGPDICASSVASTIARNTKPNIEIKNPLQRDIEEKLAERFDVGKQYFKSYYAGEVK